MIQEIYIIFIFLEGIEAKLGPPCYVKILRVESKKATRFTFSRRYYFKNIKYLYKRYAVY